MVRRFEGHSDRVSDFAASPDGRLLLSSSDDNTVRLWDIDSGKELQKTSGRGGTIVLPRGQSVIASKALCYAVDFAPDGHSALFGESWWGTLRNADGSAGQFVSGGSLVEWDVDDWREKGRSDAALRKVGPLNFIQGTDRILEVRNRVTGRQARFALGPGVPGRRSTGGPGGQRGLMAFSADGRYALQPAIDQAFLLYDVVQGSQVGRFETQTNIESLALSPDGRLALSAGESGTQGDYAIRLWDMQAKSELRRFEGHTLRVSKVTFSADGQLALSQAADNTLRIWDVATGRLIRSFDYAAGDFAPDARTVLCATRNRELVLFQVDSNRENRLSDPYIDNFSIGPLVFLADNQHFLTTTLNNTITLFELPGPIAPVPHAADDVTLGVGADPAAPDRTR